MTMADLEQEMSGAKDTAMAYFDAAKQEQRPLTDAEEAEAERYQEYFTYLDTELRPKVEGREKLAKFGASGGGQQAATPSFRQSQPAEQPHQPEMKQANPSVPNLINPKLKHFTKRLFGDVQNAQLAALHAGHWFRATMGQASKQKRESLEFCKRYDHLRLDMWDESFDAQTVDDNTRGGHLVPTIVAATIIDVRDRYGLIADLAWNYPMQGESDNITKRAGGLTVYKNGEDAAITTSEKTLGQVPVSTVDAHTLTYISHKLMRGSILNAADLVVDEIGYAFAKQQDYEGINGDGTSGAPDWDITGVMTGVGAAGVQAAAGNSWGAITWANIGELVALLPDRFHSRSNTAGQDSGIQGGPVFVCSRTFWADVLEPLMEAAGGNTKMDYAGPTSFSMKGYPVRFSEEMPTATGTSQKCLIFGNFRDSMVLAQREDVGIASSSDFRFGHDQITIRGRISYDLNFHEAGDGSNAGGIVVLETTA